MGLGTWKIGPEKVVIATVGAGEVPLKFPEVGFRV